jgi:hypothetical protein
MSGIHVFDVFLIISIKILKRLSSHDGKENNFLKQVKNIEKLLIFDNQFSISSMNNLLITVSKKHISNVALINVISKVVRGKSL